MNSVSKFSLTLLSLIIACSAFSTTVIAADLDKRVEIIERRLRGLADLMMQVETLKRENSQLRGQIEEQNFKIDALKKRQRDLYIDLDSRLSRQQTPPAVTAVTPVNPNPVSVNNNQSAKALNQVTPDNTPVSPEQTVKPIVQQSAAGISVQEQADYDAAFKLLSPSQKRYGDAIIALQTFLQTYPTSALADNAQYWLAEANYVSRNNQQALEAFDKLIALYPDSPKVSGALLKKGYLQHAAGDKATAVKTLQMVIDRYPGTAAANMAKSRIQRIQSER